MLLPRPLAAALATLLALVAATPATAQTDPALHGVWRSVTITGSDGSPVPIESGIVVFTPSGTVVIASDDDERADVTAESCIGTYTADAGTHTVRPTGGDCPADAPAMTARYTVDDDRLEMRSGPHVSRFRRLGSPLR